MARQLVMIASGEWQRSPTMTDYRVEWVSGMLVERATWTHEAAEIRIGRTVVAAPGYIWFRFWLQETEQVVEKYFDAARNAVGLYVPITASWRRRDTRMIAPSLFLGLWFDAGGRLTVFNEHLFDNAAKAGDLTPIEVEQAEQRIRTLTAAINQKKFPPSVIKNLQLEPGKTA
jgi:predicted RNA-binding protein associated with RNAse of E/G family